MDQQAYRQRDLRHLWHPYTRRSAQERSSFPLIVRGEGPFLYDAAGRRYLDAIASWWACNLGHSHPRLLAAMQSQAAQLQHSILGNLSHPRAIELADAVANLLPGRPRRVLFASDGASAVEAALKIAVQYRHNIGQPRRHGFASLEDAYHGDTLGDVSVGYLEAFHRQFQPLLFPVHRAESPCCAACRHGLQPETCGAACFDGMAQIIDRHAADLTAVVVEPLCQGAAGIRIYAPAYLRRLRDACDRHGLLLIADEVAVGMGRTGRMFACQHAGIEPDIVCLGKALSGGYLPLSATVVSEDIARTFDDSDRDNTFYHGHTFSGNPVACALALEVLAIYKEQQIVARAEELGRVMASSLSRLAGLPCVANVRALGMIGAAELCDTPSRSGAELARQTRELLLRRGILLRPLGNVVYTMPPLVTPEELVVETVAALGDCLQTAAG